MIGDVLVSSVLCEHIKLHIPDAEVHYLVNDHTVAVVEGNPFIDRIVVFKRAYRGSNREFYGFLKSISKEHYEVVIDIYGKLESNLITLFSAAKIKIAYPKWYSKILFTHTVPLYPRSENISGVTMRDRLGLLRPIISEPLDLAKRPKIRLTQEETEAAKIFLKEENIDSSVPLMMIGVLGSSLSKTYPHNYMAYVLDEVVLQTDANLLFNYIPSQEKEAKEIYVLCKPKTKSKISLGTFAPSLRKFLGLLSQCNALIGNEGGAVNMAKALSVPTFSIYSPWIEKMGWHTYANEKNVAVHLKDYNEHLFSGKDQKALKKHNALLYQEFKPQLFKEDLVTFLGHLKN